MELDRDPQREDVLESGITPGSQSPEMSLLVLSVSIAVARIETTTQARMNIAISEQRQRELRPSSAGMGVRFVAECLVRTPRLHLSLAPSFQGKELAGRVDAHFRESCSLIL